MCSETLIWHCSQSPPTRASLGQSSGATYLARCVRPPVNSCHSCSPKVQGQESQRPRRWQTLNSSSGRSSPSRAQVRRVPTSFTADLKVGRVGWLFGCRRCAAASSCGRAVASAMLPRPSATLPRKRQQYWYRPSQRHSSSSQADSAIKLCFDRADRCSCLEECASVRRGAAT
eukprot:COSAG04_NODE_1054_length_8546_cov_3.545046_9_plen_173_part_00